MQYSWRTALRTMHSSRRSGGASVSSRKASAREMAQFSELIPELRPFARELVRAAGAAGLLPRVTSTRRSFAEQKRLYSRYLAGLSPYPAAPPGHSAHEYGFAFDMIVSPLEDLVDVGQYW